MFTIFGKKKLKQETVANLFVNTLLDTVEKGFPEVAGIINDAPEFTTCPNINPKNANKFLVTVIAGNLKFLSSTFNKRGQTTIIEHTYFVLSQVFSMDIADFKELIKKEQAYISKVNFPSKNTLYGMSKAVFRKYNLNEFQDEYFKNMNSPNPMFLKKLDEVMENFVWNWDVFLSKHQVA